MEEVQLMLRKVLIVESDISVRNYLAEWFQKKNIDHDAVGSGAGALDAIDKNYYDICLLDIHIKDMHGFETAREIRNRSASKIILMTGSYSLEIIENAWRCGEYLLLKPFTPMELMNVLNLLFYNYNSHTH